MISFQRTQAGDHQFIRLRRWGMHAGEAELEVVLEHLWKFHEAEVISTLLAVFANRALPVFDACLINFCQHADSEVRRCTFNALQNNEHALIRAFALSQIERGTPEGAVVSLFYQQLSARRRAKILASLELPDGDFRNFIRCSWT